MSKNDEVFELIKSLTKNEKRFFKIFSKRHGNKNDLKYLQLFEVYDSFLDFDQVAFKEMILKKGLETNLRNIKHQLNLQLLRSLNTYHYNSSVEYEVISLLQNTQLLIDKGLLIQAQKTVEQAKVKAQKYDLNFFLLECLNKEKFIVRELYDKPKLEYFANSGFEDEKKILNEYLLLCQVQQLRNELVLTSREAYNFSVDELKIKTNILERKIGNLSTDVKSTFHNIEMNLVTKAYFYFFSEKYMEAIVIQDKLFNLYKEHPEHLEQNLLTYISTTYNSVIANFIQKQFLKVEEHLNTLDYYRLSSSNRLINLKLFTYLNIGLAFYNQKGDFEKSSSYEENILKGLKNYNTALHVFAKASLHLHLIVSFIGLKQYEKANIWASKALNNLPQKNIETQFLIAKILMLIVAFEQKRHTYLSYIANQFYEELNDVQNKFKSLKIIVSFFSNNQFETLSKDELNAILEKLKINLAVVFEDEEERVIFDVFNFMVWIDSIQFNQSYQYLIKLYAPIHIKTV